MSECSTDVTQEMKAGEEEEEGKAEKPFLDEDSDTTDLFVFKGGNLGLYLFMKRLFCGYSCSWCDHVIGSGDGKTIKH